MNLKQSIQHSPEEFVAICKSFDIQSLYAFGSSVRDDFDEESSDIDLLIEMNTQDPITKGEQIMAIWDRFESFFKRKVDKIRNQKLEIRNQKLEIRNHFQIIKLTNLSSSNLSSSILPPFHPFL